MNAWPRLRISAYPQLSVRPLRSAAPAVVWPIIAKSYLTFYCRSGLDASPVNQILIDESLLGWKEYEMEVVRDKAQITRLSSAPSKTSIQWACIRATRITVAPGSDTHRQRVPNHAQRHSIAVLREIGVETGGSNVQWAVNPADGRMVVIEMNPRVSRSSALASKATGLSHRQDRGQTRHRLHARRARQRHHQGHARRAFEPTIDYVVTKIPRFAFEKFPGAVPVPDHGHEIRWRGNGHRPNDP